MATVSYASAGAFRTGLEQRLQHAAKASGLPLQRVRRDVAFDRFLARLFTEADPPWLLKGGYALELRLGRAARGTIDVDLGLPDLAGGKDELAANLLHRLEGPLAADLGDWFTFRVVKDLGDLLGPAEGGTRFLVDALVDQRSFVKFHVDIAVGETRVLPPDRLTGPDLLAFAGVLPARPLVIPTAQQFAEKLHAYTRLHLRAPNSRVRDLVDMVLLIQAGPPNRGDVAKAVAATYAGRGTHEIPPTLSPPPESWRQPFEAMATEIELSPRDSSVAFEIVRAYWETMR